MDWNTIYKVYRRFAFVFHIAVFLLVLLAVLPLATKSIAVEHVGKTKWYFDGKNIILSTPVTIKNNGVYDINNLNLLFKVNNKTATFIDSGQNLGNIQAGTTKTVNVSIPINLTHLYQLEEPDFYHIYNYDSFHVEFSIALNYMLNLVSVDTLYNAEVQWQPIVKEFTLHEPKEIKEEGSKLSVEIPYTICTADYLSGTSEFTGTVNSKGKLGTFSTQFSLGEQYNGTLHLLLDKNSSRTLITKSQTLHLDGNMSLGNIAIPLSTDYRWGAPLNDFHYKLLSNRTIYYSFENDAPFMLNLTITKDYYYHSNLVGHDTEKLTVAKGERVTRYEPITVTQLVDKVVLTCSDSERGIYYQEVINL